MGEPTPGALRGAIRALVRRGLRGVWLRGRLPAGPLVWAANHHSWWDPFLALALLHRLGRDGSVLIDQANLRRYPFARAVGGFGTAEHRRGLAHLTAGRVLLIYPEGELRPPGPPGRLAAGAGWYARTAGVPLCAAATRVVLRGEQSPEAYVWLERIREPERLADRLGDRLSDLDRLVGATDPRRPLPGFLPVLTGVRSWDERVDRLTRWLPWPR